MDYCIDFHQQPRMKSFTKSPFVRRHPGFRVCVFPVFFFFGGLPGKVYLKTLLSSDGGFYKNCFLRSRPSGVLSCKAEFMKKSLVSPSRLIVEFHGCKSITTECPSFW